MAKYFEYFPKVLYDINQYQRREYNLSTNILFRIRLIREVVRNASSYYQYTIKDGDKPEILAEKVYDDPEAHWIILYANDIIDPQYDWPLDQRSFNKHIIDKYGSIAYAKTNFHHYEKVIERLNSTTNTTTTKRIIIDQTQLSDDAPEPPYDAYDQLSETQDVSTFTINGDTITETIYRNAVSYYDYENELNEAKRNIKIIKKEFYSRIVNEFKFFTNYSELTTVRTII